MKEIKVTDEIFEEDYFFDESPENTISYIEAANCYVKRSGREKLIKIFKMDREEFVDVISGNMKKYFPEYDKNKHTFDKLIYSNYPVHNDHVYVGVYEKELDSVKLPYGHYKISVYNHEYCLVPVKINTNKYIDIGRNTSALIYEDFTFWKDHRKFYEDEDQLHKRGIFIFGPPGNGKSMEINRLLKKTQDDKFYAIILDSRTDLAALNAFKQCFSGSEIVIVMEEITERLRHFSMESMLTFLDGQDSWNNSYVIATTNHPEELAPNLIDRPGRFSKIIEVKAPNDEQKRKYLKARDVSDEDAEIIIEFAGKDISLDYIREIVNVAKVNNKGYKETIEEIKNMRKRVKGKFTGKIGLQR